MEDHNHISWICKAVDKNELENLLKLLNENKLYKQYQHRKKMMEVKKQEEIELKEQIANLEAENIGKTAEDFEPNTCFSCEVCSEEYNDGLDLLKHYARTHLACKMREKFSHLVDKSTCKLCKTDIENEAEMYVHIATDHDKINTVLKENGLKTIEMKVDHPKPASVTPNNEKDRDCENNQPTLKDLEEKLKAVQKQMSDSVQANIEIHTMADIADIAAGFDDHEDTNENVPVKEKKRDKKKKKKRGRPKKETWSSSPPAEKLRRSSRRSSHVSEHVQSSKVTDVTRDSKVKERVETRVSCVRCGQWEMEPSNKVVTCSHCDQAWHQKCVTPALTRRPGTSWQCPVCDHCQLVTSLQDTLAELEVLIDKVEERRLAEMEVLFEKKIFYT